MKKLFIMIFLISTAAEAVAQKVEANLSIMSFNIRYGTAYDGNDSWQYRKDHVFELLKQSSPDIIGFQEVLKFQLDELQSALPEYAVIGISRKGNWEDEFSAIFYKKKVLAPRKTNTYWLSDTPEIPSNGWGNDILRIVTWAEFKHLPSNQSFYLYNAHFDHISQISRLKGAQHLAEVIKKRDHPYPVIITGDFNAGEDNPAIEVIKSAGFADTFRVKHPMAMNVGTFNEFKGINTGDKIDYVFTGDGIDIQNADIDRTNKDGVYPSDHYPVTAKVKLLN